MAFTPAFAAFGSQFAIQEQQPLQQRQQSPPGGLCALSISARALDSVNGLASVSPLDHNP